MPHAAVFSPSARAARSSRRFSRRAFAGLAAGTTAVIASAVAAPVWLVRGRTSAQPLVDLAVASDPAGAAVVVDGNERGRTPTPLGLTPGAHRVALRDADTLPWVTTIHAGPGRAAPLDAVLWRRSPTVETLRPPLPGSTIAGAAFLADGGVALDVTLPPGDDHQLWRAAAGGALRRLGPPDAPGPIAATPDGGVAYLAPAAEKDGASPPESGNRPLSTVWVAPPDQAATLAYRLPAGTEDARLVDLTWSPDAAHLLLACALRRPDGGSRTRLLWLDRAHGTSRVLVELPSDIVTGSYAWGSGGDRVAFLAHTAGATTLCLLEPATAQFRSLADLSSASAWSPFAPLSWDADSRRAVFAAPVPSRTQTLSAALFGAAAAPGIFTWQPDGNGARRLGVATGAWPTWGPDGAVLALAPMQGGTTALVVLDPATGEVRDRAPLPLPSGAAFAVRWDARHGRALVAQRRDGGVVAFSLLSFRPEVR